MSEHHNLDNQKQNRSMTTNLRERIVAALLSKFTVLPASDIEAAAEIAAVCKISFDGLDEHGLLKGVECWLKRRSDKALTYNQKALLSALDPYAPNTVADDSGFASIGSSGSSIISSDNDDDDDDDDDMGIDADAPDFTQAYASEPTFDFAKDDSDSECSSDNEVDSDEDVEEDQEKAAWIEFWSQVRAKPRMSLDVDDVTGSYVVRLADEAQSLSARVRGQTLEVSGVLLPATREERAALLEQAHRRHAALHSASPTTRERHRFGGMATCTTPHDYLLRLGRGRFGRVLEAVALPADADTTRASARHNETTGALVVTVPRAAAAAAAAAAQRQRAPAPTPTSRRAHAAAPPMAAHQQPQRAAPRRKKHTAPPPPPLMHPQYQHHRRGPFQQHGRPRIVDHQRMIHQHHQPTLLDPFVGNPFGGSRSFW